MSQSLQRKELGYLLEWLERPKRKPLVIRGARQVGKSTLVQQFAKVSGMQLLEFNFERNPEYGEAFLTNEPLKILSILQLLSGCKVVAGETLLFLDEIQAAPEALSALRYFYEELPDLHIVAAGSLLEFALDDAEFSMPVGRIEYFHLGPMQFDDFLLAMNQDALVENLKSLSISDISKSSISHAVHDKYLQWLKEFWVVGGLPEAVASYAQTRDFTEVGRVHQGIVATYRDDFNKYSHGKLSKLVQRVFDQLPLMVGRKFKYANVSRDHKAADIERALQQLCLARIATKVTRTSANGIPLGAEANPRYFKTLYFDVGLMSAALHLNLIGLAKGDISPVNNGALAEQYIGQQLLYSSLPYKTPALFYWAREAKSSSAEIDYLMTIGQHIIPIEVKAGATGTLKSIHQFLAEKQSRVALRFNASPPSLLRDTKKLTDGSDISYVLISLPMYMVDEAPRLVSEYIE